MQSIHGKGGKMKIEEAEEEIISLGEQLAEAEKKVAWMEELLEGDAEKLETRIVVLKDNNKSTRNNTSATKFFEIREFF